MKLYVLKLIFALMSTCEFHYLPEKKTILYLRRRLENPQIAFVHYFLRSEKKRGLTLIVFCQETTQFNG
jgi:hypothetical protein